MSIPCIICHEVFENDNDVIALKNCGHIYHGNCLEDWKKSSQQCSKAACPVCRKSYDKRTIRKLYFNVEEPEINYELGNDLKRQKIYSENLISLNEKLQKELMQKDLEISKLKESCMQSSNELNKIKIEYGIKCQAYSIIDNVNNEYLQDNKKLRDENERLKNELKNMKQLSRKQNVKLECSKIVDLTCSNCESDDELQIIENPKKSEVIEIDDDSNDVKIFQSPPSNPESTTEGNQSSNSCDDEQMRSAKKLCENDDYKRFEDFILSQI